VRGEVISNSVTLLSASGSSIELGAESIVGIYPAVVGAIVAVEAGDDLIEHEVLETANEVSRRWVDARGLAHVLK
jgi:hypothetical protein